MTPIYLDNAATSFPKPPEVVEAVYDFMKNIGTNITRGGYRNAYRAETTVFETRERLLKRLREIPELRILGRPDAPSSSPKREDSAHDALEAAPQAPAYCPVLSLLAPGLPHSELAFRLDERFRISSRVGLHCAPSAHKAFGSFPEGSLRLSIGYFNTEEEIDRTADALRELILELSRNSSV